MASFLVHFLTALSILSGNLAVFGSDDQVLQVERDVLKARRQITSGEFVILVDSSRDPRPFKFEVHSWVGPNECVRQELTFGPNTEVVCLGEVAAFHYDYRIGQFSNPNRKMWPNIYLDATANVRGRGTYKLYDPLLIMFTPQRFSMIGNGGLEQFVGSSARQNVRFGKSTWSGHPAYRISFDLQSSGLHYYYDVVPDLGFGIVLFACEGTIHSHGAELHYEQIATCKEMLKVNSTVWFPKKVDFNGTIDGQIKVNERITVDVKSINASIAKSTFTPGGGAGVPDGVLIVYEGKGGGTTRPARPTTQPTLLAWENGAVRRWTSSDTSAVALSAYPRAAKFVRPKYARVLAILLFLLVTGGLAYYILASRRERERGSER